MARMTARMHRRTGDALRISLHQPRHQLRPVTFTLNEKQYALSDYPAEPSEEYVAELQAKLYSYFGLDSSSEFDIVSDLDDSAQFSLRALRSGVYRISLFRVACPIRPRTFHNHLKTTMSIGGEVVLSKRGGATKLKVWPPSK